MKEVVGPWEIKGYQQLQQQGLDHTAPDQDAPEQIAGELKRFFGPGLTQDEQAPCEQKRG